MAGYAITFVEGPVRKIELKHAASGTAICEFFIPTDNGWGDAKWTEWYNCSCFGKRAEALAKYVKVGAALVVTGKIKTQKWENKDGHKCQRTNLIVDDWHFGSGGKQQQDADEEPDAKPVTGKKKAEEEDEDEDLEGLPF